MKFNDKMNYSEKITEFIDGELTQEESSELFTTLAQNPELQEELRQSILLKNMFHQELLTPPPISRTHVYAKLNLHRGAVILSFLITAFLNFRKLFMNPAFSSALIGIGLFTLGLFMTSSNEQVKSNSSKNSSTEMAIERSDIKKSMNSVNQANVPIISSALIPEKMITPKKIVPIFKENLSEEPNIVPNKLSDNSLLNSNINQNSGNSGENLFGFYEIGLSNPYINKQNIIIPKSSRNFLSSIGYEISSILESISLSISKTNSISSINLDLDPLSNPLLNNYSIALSYTMNKNNVLSVELGQENFPQKFVGKINGYDAAINQVYTAQWFGISYQYNFGEISSLYSLNPFSKILVSGTSIGPYLKGSLGLSYQLTDKIALHGALEASRLAYSFQSTWFNTDKYGFIYGVKIGF